VDPGNFADVAAMQPGVARSGSGLSIAGQSPDQNQTTVDGASYSGASLPAEGVRSAGVITNSYDVARGQFSGGQIIASTISGTNLWGGALHVGFDDPALTYGGSPGSLSHERRSMRLSSGGGGPLLRDRLFAYGALDLSRSRSPTSGLELLDAPALARLGLSPDSVRRFLDIVQRIGAYSPPDRAPSESGNDMASALARFDYTISDHHSLTARLNWRRSSYSGIGASPFSVLQAADKVRSSDAGVLVQLTSGAGLWGNELRVYHANGNTLAGAALALPHAEVSLQTLSAVAGTEGATESASSVGFGGIPFTPDEKHSLTELSDQVVRETTSGVHRMGAGFVLQQQRGAAETIGNRYGSFLFNSLGDLEQGQPALFSRNLAQPPRPAARTYGAVYVGDVWQLDRSFGVIYGLRLDGNRYGKRSAPAAAVVSLAPDARTQVPSDLFVTPRFGFRYSPGNGDWVVDGGLGGFGGETSIASLASLWGDTGSGNSHLVCVGAVAPQPDWSAYGSDVSTIPSTCASGTSNFASSAPSATLFDPNFGSPRTWRASLSADGAISPLWGVHMNTLVVHGTHLPTAIDRNFAPIAAFTLPEEEGRPVYASTADILPTTGGMAPGASRVNASLGEVREIGSRGESWTEQITAGTGGIVGRSNLWLDYTFTRSRVLGSAVPAPGAVGTTTADDPTRLEWSESPFTPRHAFQGALTFHIGGRVRVAAIGRLTSGLPFTPIVAQDINGDGFGNDRAFVFSRTTAPNQSVARDMATLQNTAPGFASDCLRRQAGQIAKTGICHTPWTSSLDLRANVLALGDVNSRRLIVTLTASNITAGLDYMLHGPDKLRGWGQYPYPDATLLQVRGFNSERRAFEYAVNPRFGQPAGGGISRIPFRISLQARITFGADPRYQPLLAAIRAGTSESNASMREDVARQIRNVPAIVLQLIRTDSAAPSIALAQQAQLQAVADSLAPQIAAAGDSLVAVLIERGPVTAARSARRQEAVEHARVLVAVAVRRTREILTPKQWGQLPGWLIKPADVKRLASPIMRGTMSIGGSYP
jgi:hypothetical protein